MSSNRANIFQKLYDSDADRQDGAEMILPQGTRVEGKLVCESRTVIDGNVAGELVANDRLLIGPNAVIEAGVKAQDVIIRGIVKGNVVATTRISLGSTASIDGDLLAPTLVMEDGAQVSGQVRIMKDQADVAATPQISANDPVVLPPARNG